MQTPLFQEFQMSETVSFLPSMCHGDIANNSVVGGQRTSQGPEIQSCHRLGGNKCFPQTPIDVRRYLPQLYSPCNVRCMPMMYCDLPIVSHAHKASRWLASRNDTTMPHRATISTTDTSAAQVVSRDFRCDLRHMPCIVPNLPDPCVPLVRLHPEPRSRVRPHVQILKSPPRGLERKRLFLVSDVRRFDIAFPGVWLGQQPAYHAGQLCCGVRFRRPPLAISCSRSLVKHGAGLGANRALIRCKKASR